MSSITLTGVTSVAPDPLRPNVAVVTFSALERDGAAGEKDGAPAPRTVEGRIAFLDEGIVRYTVDPAGAFAPYAKPVSPEHAASPSPSTAWTRCSASLRAGSPARRRTSSRRAR